LKDDESKVERIVSQVDQEEVAQGKRHPIPPPDGATTVE
jgi:hypothetical protein